MIETMNKALDDEQKHDDRNHEIQNDEIGNVFAPSVITLSS